MPQVKQFEQVTEHNPENDLQYLKTLNQGKITQADHDPGNDQPGTGKQPTELSPLDGLLIRYSCAVNN